MIEAVAYHEDIRNDEPAVFDGGPDLATLCLVQEGTQGHAVGRLGLQQASQVVDGVPGVDDVLDDHHVAVDQGDVRRLGEAGPAEGGAGVAVALQSDKIALTGDLEASAQISPEDGRSLQHAKQKKISTRVVVGDRSRQLPHACLDVSG